MRFGVFSSHPAQNQAKTRKITRTIEAQEVSAPFAVNAELEFWRFLYIMIPTVHFTKLFCHMVVAVELAAPSAVMAVKRFQCISRVWSRSWLHPSMQMLKSGRKRKVGLCNWDSLLDKEQGTIFRPCQFRRVAPRVQTCTFHEALSAQEWDPQQNDWWYFILVVVLH